MDDVKFFLFIVFVLSDFADRIWDNAWTAAISDVCCLLVAAGVLEMFAIACRKRGVKAVIRAHKWDIGCLGTLLILGALLLLRE